MNYIFARWFNVCGLDFARQLHLTFSGHVDAQLQLVRE